MPENKDIGLLWHSFMYEVDRATASLFYLLQGMESVRATELQPYNKLPATQKTYIACFAKVSYIHLPLSMSGPAFDLNDVLQHEGEAEQLAFKGWLEQIYNCIWEGRYRNDLKRMHEAPGAIRPQGDPIGDLRLIRNDLVHKGAIASAEGAGKCEVLGWFKVGQPMLLGVRHVLDFLNQMGFMTTTPGFLSHGPNASWTVFPDVEQALKSVPVPKPVSLRMSFVREAENGATWHVASIVFENGVFADVPIELSLHGQSVTQRIEWIDRARIDQDGNLRFPNGTIKDRRTLYSEAVDALVGPPRKIEGMYTPGPWFRIKKD